MLRRPPTVGLASAATAVAVVAALCLSACGGGSTRSAEAYCEAFYSHAAPLRQGYVNADKQASQQPLQALVTLLSAPGDLAAVFDAMVPHAPDEIQSDTKQVRDAFKKMQDTMGKAVSDPLGALGDSLGNSLSSSGSFNRVDQYLAAHCPPSSALAQKYIKAAR
jgi:hypothetical protein